MKKTISIIILIMFVVGAPFMGALRDGYADALAVRAAGNDVVSRLGLEFEEIDDYGYEVVCLMGKRVVGFAKCAFYGEEMHLHDIYVDYHLVRMGIGEELWKRVLQKFREAGASKLVTLVREKDSDRLAFFQKMARRYDMGLDVVEDKERLESKRDYIPLVFTFNEPHEGGGWLYRNMRFNIVTLDNIIRKAAARLSEKLTQRVEATLFGGMRYMQDGTRGDIDIAIVAEGIEESRWEELADAFIVELQFELDRYNIHAQKDEEKALDCKKGHAAALRIELPSGRMISSDIFVHPSWEAYACIIVIWHLEALIRHLKQPHSLAVLDSLPDPCEAQPFIAALYYLGYREMYREAVAAIDEQGNLPDDYRPKQEFVDDIVRRNLDSEAISSIVRVLQTPIVEIMRQMAVVEPAPEPSDTKFSI